jgi:hypothetical protein
MVGAVRVLADADRSAAKVYLVGDGIASLAAAVFIIRDGDVLGRNIRSSGNLIPVSTNPAAAQLTVRTVERSASRNVWLDEHVTFALSSGKEFEIVCTRRASDVAEADRPFPCLAASIGDKLAVGYLDQIGSDGLARVLQISREGDHS